MNNIELFNEYTGKIFEKLYKEFPVKSVIDCVKIAEDIENIKICESTVEWLEDNGFIKSEDRDGAVFFGVVLTLKGLELLKLPSGIKKRDIGMAIVEMMKLGSIEGVKEIIKEGLTQLFKNTGGC